jgi:hypothetical protein
MEQTPIDQIVVAMAGGVFEEEVKRARSEYFKQIQDLREDDPSYERLTFCFLNWYVFDRPMDSGEGTPLQIFVRRTQLAPEERARLIGMAGNIHSLFEVKKLGGGRLSLRDLFTGESIPVVERRHVAGLQRSDILEARLIPLDNRLVFSPGAFLLHPRAAKKIIQHAVKRSRKEGRPAPSELIHRLQALNFRYTDRFRERVQVEKVYSELISWLESDAQPT